MSFAVRHIYVSPGHNYFGHHGKDPGSNPMVEVDEVRCVTGRGLEGDRFWDYKRDYKGQVTFFAIEMYRKLCTDLMVKDRSPAAFRRNIITEGANLNDLIGVQFEVQGIRYEGTAECSPCYWMDGAFADGAEAALKGNGGLRARILSDGILRVQR